MPTNMTQFVLRSVSAVSARIIATLRQRPEYQARPYLALTSALAQQGVNQAQVQLCGAAVRPPWLPTSPTRSYCSVDELVYERVSEETLESLAEELEELVVSDAAPPDCDILFNSGVLTVQLGSWGTYVINKQAPNKQLWLSSPVSGPKRFNLVDDRWVYRQTGDVLHAVLCQELSKVFQQPVNLSHCAYAGKKEG